MRRWLAAAVFLAAGCSGPSGTVGEGPTLDTGTIGEVGDPRNRAKLHTELASLYFTRGGMSVALDELRLAVAADSSYAPAYGMFGVVYQDLKENRLAEDNFERARDKAKWNSRVKEVWDRVRIVETSPAPTGAVTSGKAIQVRAAVELAGLKPNDVRVEAVIGRVGTSGTLEETEVIVLPPTEQLETVAVFTKEITPRQTGRLGYALRVSPNH